MRKSHPQNFARAIPTAAKEVFARGQQTVLEHRDAIGRRIFLFRYGILPYPANAVVRLYFYHVRAQSIAAYFREGHK